MKINGVCLSPVVVKFVKGTGAGKEWAIIRYICTEPKKIFIYTMRLVFLEVKKIQHEAKKCA